MPSEASSPAAPARAAADPGVNPGARALYSVATSFDGGTDPETALFALVHRAAEAVGARRGWLLVDGGAGPGRVAAAWPDPGDRRPGRSGRPGDHADPPSAACRPSRRHPGARPSRLRRRSARRSGASPPPCRIPPAPSRRWPSASPPPKTRPAAPRTPPPSRPKWWAAVDHDLRTPLTTVLGALQTLARPEFAPADPDLAALLESALGQAKRLRLLLGDLLLASSTTCRTRGPAPPTPCAPSSPRPPGAAWGKAPWCPSRSRPACPRSPWTLPPSGECWTASCAGPAAGAWRPGWKSPPGERTPPSR